MEGRLSVNQVDGTVELCARVVEYVGDAFAANRPLFSWHGRLTAYEHGFGELALDDGRTMPVVVDYGFLRPL
jgi:hypothetical protein